MKRISAYLFLTFLLCMAEVKVYAYDIAAKNAQGDMIYYDIINDNELSVTYQERRTPGFAIYYDTFYEGDLVIPEKVIYNGEVYTVTQIGNYAFCKCSGLTSLSLPKSIKKMSCYQDSNSQTTFIGCENLTAIKISDISSWCAIDFGIASYNYCNPLSNGACLYLNGVLVEDLIIPDGVTTISEGAFKNCNQITSVRIPSSVTSIGKYSLYSENLLSVTSKIEMPFDCKAFLSNTQRNGTLYIPKGTKDYYIRFDGWRQFLNIVEVEEEIGGNDTPLLLTYNAGEMKVTRSANSELTGEDFTYSINPYADIYESLGIDPYVFDANYEIDGENLIFNQYYMDGGVLKACSSSEANHKNANDALGVFGPGDSSSSFEWRVSAQQLVAYVNKLGSESPNLTRYFKIKKKQTSTISGPDEICIGVIPSQLTISDATSGFAITVHVTEAGTLSNYISDAQKYSLKELTITGPLNSTDFKLLRDMAGNNYLGNETEGQLQKLDLSGASIVIGGEYYLEAEFVYYQPGYGSSTSGDHLAIENDNELGKDVFKGCKLKEVILPDNLTSIAYGAFDYCKYLTDVVMPEGLTRIGDSAFLGCDLLQPPSIPTSVETIGRYAFAYCYGFTSFDIPNGITTLEDNVFYKCTNLTNVVIPASVTEIKSQVFELCNSLEIVEIYAKDPPSTNYHSFTTQANATLYVPYGCKSAYATTSPWNEFKQIIEMEQNESPAITFADAEVKAICLEHWDSNGDGKLTEAEAAAVTSIGTVFTFNDEIQSFNELKYFTSVEEIDYMAFYECTKLKSITFPQSVTTINYWSFFGCRSLTSLKLPDGLVYLYDDAFEGCNGLTTVTIPANVYAAKNKIYATSSFPSCKNLKEIIVDPGNPYLESVDNVLYLKDHSGIMQYPAGKTDATYNILEGVEGIFGRCFSGCEYLTSVKLPEGLRYVNGPVFSNCVNLEEIELPSSLVTFDGYNLIYGCTNLEKIVSHITAPQSVDFKVFQVKDGEFTSATLYVPNGTKSLYQATDGWKNFKNIVEVSTNTLHCIDLQASPGSKAVLAVNMTNENEVKLCQFDLRLPAGVTVALKSNGKLDAKLTERAETHSISSQQLSNGNYRFIISSMDNDSFTGNNGTLVEITLDIPATMETGEYTVKLLNAELSVPDGTDLKVVKPADTESKLTIKAYTPGDVNNDGSVSVTDVGCAINYILEQVPSVFIFEAADMNGDKSISVTDVGMIINLILNEGSAGSPQLNRAGAENAYLTQLRTTDGYQLQLENKDAFIGFQMDLQMANGATIKGMKLIGGDDHLMTYRQLANGTWRVVCYSPTNNTFVANDAALLNITTDGNVTISNVRLTTADLREVCLDAISGGTTGITDVKGLQGEELKVYSLDGRLCRTIRVQQGENPLNGLKAGVYMIGNRKVVVR